MMCSVPYIPTILGLVAGEDLNGKGGDSSSTYINNLSSHSLSRLLPINTHNFIHIIFLYINI